MVFSEEQKKILSFIPHFTGPISFVGSSWIIYECVSDPNKWKKTYHRLLLGMAVFDALSSLSLGLSTWPIPKGSPSYATLGNVATCSAQGFFIQSNIGSPLYNFCLSLFYLCLVKYNISEERMRSSFEPWMHGISITFSYGTAIVCLSLGMFNDSNLWCWINAAPRDCTQSFKSTVTTDCERGDNAELFRWVLFYVPLWAAILGTMTTMFLLWQAVRRQELVAAKWCNRFIRAAHTSPSTDSTTIKGKSRSMKESILNALGIFASSKKREADLENETRAGGSNNKAGSNFGATGTTPQSQTGYSNMPQKRVEHSSRRHRKSNLVKYQALRFVAVFWITWLPASLNRILEVAGHDVFAMLVLHAILVPFQGLFNLAVYKYPEFHRWQRKRQKEKKAEERRKQRAALRKQTELGYTIHPIEEHEQVEESLHHITTSAEDRVSGVDYHDGLSDSSFGDYEEEYIEDGQQTILKNSVPRTDTFTPASSGIVET